MTAKEKDTVQFQEQVATVCQHYLAAPERFAAGTHTISVDEKTGIQALSRSNQKPVTPGIPERQEYEYERNGTQCLIGNLEVATGQIVSPTIGPTRTEDDFAKHLERTVATDPDACWIFMVDNLNTHSSASLVRWVAKACGLTEDLGCKARRGPLKTQATRMKFLSDTSHRIRFVYLPKHTSWLNQIEIWFSVLQRRVLKRGNFKTVEELAARINAYIVYYNAHKAKPYRWTFTGRPLAEKAQAA